MPGCLFWVVDDDADDLVLIEQGFSEFGLRVSMFQPDRAGTILDRFEAEAAKNPPQMIMLDINMPFISGKELLVLLKSDPRFRHIPIVMFTTSTSHQDKMECMRAGANCFLTKPATFTELTKICDSLSTLFCSGAVSVERAR
ncbi:MAG: response regulator [Gemmatimonadaceae bacterium]|nr:response regulator [Chitinophagaceae bacterium]